MLREDGTPCGTRSAREAGEIFFFFFFTAGEFSSKSLGTIFRRTMAHIAAALDIMTLSMCASTIYNNWEYNGNVRSGLSRLHATVKPALSDFLTDDYGFLAKFLSVSCSSEKIILSIG